MHVEVLEYLRIFSALLGRQSDRPMIRDLQVVKYGHFLYCTVLNVYDFWKVSMAKYHTLIFETILLNYTGPSVHKPLLFSFVFLFSGGELFKVSKMIFAMNEES